MAAPAVTTLVEGDVELYVLPEGQIVTKNNAGMQMSAVSTLFEQWLAAYDGTHPIGDIGCAYGVNTLAAARRGASVIAMDFDATHLECLKLRVEREALSDRVAPTYAKLPDEFLGTAVAPSSLSGVLVSEVIHFLHPDMLPRTFRALWDSLVPGGSAFITCVSQYSSQGTLLSMFEQRRAAGHPTPLFLGVGEYGPHIAGVFAAAAAKGKPAPKEIVESLIATPSLHYFEVESLKSIVAAAGFEIVLAEYGAQPGYPAMFRGGESEYSNKENVRIIGRKPLSVATDTPIRVSGSPAE